MFGDRWGVDIVEGDITLHRRLLEREAMGYVVRFVLPNGLNRYTLVCEQVGSKPGGFISVPRQSWWRRVWRRVSAE